MLPCHPLASPTALQLLAPDLRLQTADMRLDLRHVGIDRDRAFEILQGLGIVAELAVDQAQAAQRAEVARLQRQGLVDVEDRICGFR